MTVATETQHAWETGLERFLQACEAAWPAGQARPRVLGRAPGRLDCIGGMADFSGGLALQMPLACGAHAAAGPRTDQRFRVESLDWKNNGDACVFDVPLSAFYQSDGQLVTPEKLRGSLAGCEWVSHAAGVCLSLLDSGDLPHLAGGVNLLISCDVPAGRGLAASAAIQVAVAQAIAGLFELELGPGQLLRACRSANEEVCGGETGLVDHVACLLAEPESLLQVRCQPGDVIGSLLLPRDVTFAAVDSGPRTDICRQRYLDNRAASIMGRTIVERLVAQAPSSEDTVNGYLANITPNEYVLKFRNDLPVKIRGKEFIERFGQPVGLDAPIEPLQLYKVRSRAEHHIYENDRAHRLHERLSRARRTGERDALVEAGELMYASHWSYSQRCGMGSLETDQLVGLIRERGPARGLYGAKITGMGCGGAVAVLMSTATAARAALEEAVQAFREKTGRDAAICFGSSPGAHHFGRRPLD